MLNNRLQLMAFRRSNGPDSKTSLGLQDAKQGTNWQTTIEEEYQRAVANCALLFGQPKQDIGMDFHSSGCGPLLVDGRMSANAGRD